MGHMSTTTTPNPANLTNLDFDRQHIWHPYSSTSGANPVFEVTCASGVYLTLADGRQIIDGMASWWSVLHGYNHPKMNQAVQEQLEKFSHVMFGGLTHSPAIELSKRLVELSPEPLDKVFLSDSGSVAVEVAMKMAIQYWHSQGNPGKNRLLALEQAYHGDTFGAMSVCDPVTGMHHLFANNLMDNEFVAPPSNTTSLKVAIERLENTLKNNHSTLAAFILEPIVQGAGGMRFYPAEYLKAARSLCDQYNVLLIADEIATGFGRTGKLFACEHAQISPDILCLGKTLTGGYMTLAATLCTEKVSAGICEGEAGVFMHGPTFMANPLACATAVASIDLLLESDWQNNVERIHRQLNSELAECTQIKGVKDIRSLGAIGVIELNEAVDMNVIQPMFVDHGVWLRPFGKLVYTMPPYSISPSELTALCTGIKTVLKEYLST